MHGHHGCCCSGGGFKRKFRSKEERLEMLKKYKAELQKELAGVEEALAEGGDCCCH